MNTLIDPRPLEPAYVRNAAPDRPDEVSWTVKTWKWDKATKSTKHAHHDVAGTTSEFLEFVADVLNSGEYHHKIIVDASCAGTVDERKFEALKFPCMSESLAWWSFADVNGSPEEGLDGDELFSWLEYLLNEQKDFTLELSDYDPTP